MDVFVPFDAAAPKTRLSPLFDEDERLALARAMLEDVTGALESAGYQPTVLATEDIDCPHSVVVDERPLTPAVNDVLAGTDGPVAVVMADLALATPAAIDRLFEPDDGVVLAPGLGAGTNAAVARHPEFRVDYHGSSYSDHLAAAEAVGADVTTVDSYQLGVDIDVPEDLPEVLVHTEGKTASMLRELGVSLVVEDGRVTVSR